MAKKDFMNLMKEKTVELRPSLLSSEENIKSQLTVLDVLKNLIPPLTPDEQQQLEQNILKHGIKDPLTIWETSSEVVGVDNGAKPVFVLVDGHNRYDLSQKHKLDFRINLVQFGSLDEVKEYMINYQLGRRNLSPEQISYLRGMRYLQQKSQRGSNLLAPTPQVNVSEALAKEYGVSSRTIKRDGEFAAGLEKIDPVLKKEILSGNKKLPKSELNALAKASPALSQPSGMDTVEQPAFSDEALRLQDEIRKLAKGRLDRQRCQQLIDKLHAYLALDSSK
ncbi:hypothetical protein [Larkinella insperata]